jgi:hypothetical protein
MSADGSTIIQPPRDRPAVDGQRSDGRGLSMERNRLILAPPRPMAGIGRALRCSRRVVVLGALAVTALLLSPGHAAAQQASCGDWGGENKYVAVGEQTWYDVNIRSGTITFSIDWGNGRSSNRTFYAPDSYRFTYAYPQPGTYYVSLSAYGTLGDGTRCSNSIPRVYTVTVGGGGAYPQPQPQPQQPQPQPYPGGGAPGNDENRTCQAIGCPGQNPYPQQNAFPGEDPDAQQNPYPGNNRYPAAQARAKELIRRIYGRHWHIYRAQCAAGSYGPQRGSTCRVYAVHSRRHYRCRVFVPRSRDARARLVAVTRLD